MKDWLEVLRGSVRPVTTYLLVVALVVLVFQHPNDLLKDFVILVTAITAYWYGGRGKGKTA
jgi:hypothetical protein